MCRLLVVLVAALSTVAFDAEASSAFDLVDTIRCATGAPRAPWPDDEAMANDLDDDESDEDVAPARLAVDAVVAPPPAGRTAMSAARLACRLAIDRVFRPPRSL